MESDILPSYTEFRWLVLKSPAFDDDLNRPWRMSPSRLPASPARRRPPTEPTSRPWRPAGYRAERWYRQPLML